VASADAVPQAEQVATPFVYVHAPVHSGLHELQFPLPSGAELTLQATHVVPDVQIAQFAGQALQIPEFK
jgi:hypothetical protein